MKLSQIWTITKRQVMIAVVCSGCLSVATHVSPSAFSQVLQVSTRVDAYLENEMRNRAIPGLALVVINDGKIVKQTAYGLASIELGVPVTTNTVFQIASATKPFASVALMLLIQEGKFNLHDSITALLPGLPEQWKDVTVKHLLTHTSGLPDVAVRPGRAELIAETRAEALQKLPSLPLPGKPGERWSYNQTNYMLVNMLVEKFSGQSLPNFLQHRFFRPLGLTSASFGNSISVVKDRATNYERRPDGQLQVRWLTFPEYLYGAAGLNLSVLDWARWAMALTSGKLLPAPALAQMWEPVKLQNGSTFDYGFGFALYGQPGHRSVGHSGGGTAAFRYFVDDKLTIVIGMNGSTNPDAVLDGIAQIYISGLATSR